MTQHTNPHIASLLTSLRRAEAALERSRREQASLQAAESRLRSLVEDMPVGLALATAEGRFIEVNRQLCTILGYSRDELLALTYLDVTHPDDRERDKRLRTGMLAGELPEVKWEKRYIRKDGTLVWANFNLTITHPRGGDPALFLAVIENISQRRNIEESLYRIATNLAQADAMSLSGTWEWNLDSGEVCASAEVFDLFGLPPSTAPVPIDRFMDRIDPQDRPMVDTALRATLDERKPYQVRYRLRLPDGGSRVMLASGEVHQRDTPERPRVMLGLLQDVTLRTRTEQALVESELRFRLLFDNAADGIFIADDDGIYTDVNRSACAMLGHTRDELIGLKVTDLLPPEDVGRLQKDRAYFRQGIEHASVAEWRLRHKDGRFVPVEVSARILPDGRWMAIARDIAERKRAQAELEKTHAEIRDLYDHAPCGYHTLDRDNMLVRINETELRWLGYAREEVVARTSMFDLLTEPCRKKFRANLPRLVQEGRLDDIEFELVRKDGSIFPVLISATGVYDADGRFMQSRMTIFDVSELETVQKKLRQTAAVFEHANDAILVMDARGIIVAANKAFTRISGYRPEEVNGKDRDILQSDAHDPEFYDTIWSALARTGSWQGEIWHRRKNGEHFPVWESITTVRDDADNVTDYISVFSDISAIKETEQRLMKLAYHDPLTGLPNRLLFNDRIKQAIAHGRRHHNRAALLMLDLDRFKLINDTLGHDVGDLLLKAVAHRLKDAIRAEDTVARLGGDEFAIVLAQIDDPADAALMAQKVARLVTQPVHLANQALTISTSIGIALYPGDGEDPATLAKSADTAMYEAKSKGRNGYRFYTREMTTAATETLLLDRDLRRALRGKELSLVYQPQVSLATGRIVGVEALARWNRPDHGPQSPARFIQIAEETDLIESIGEWAIDTALNQLDCWRMAGMAPLRMAINLSVRQVRHARFMEDMRRRLTALHAADGFGVDLELTETTLQTEAQTVETLTELKSMGLKIAIDDFGTGYSSLHSLKQLPVDILKIDRSFIHGIPSSQDDKAITMAIIAMGHSLGMQIIAEGVETQEQLQFVMDLQCDEAQGFFFYPPMDADECQRFLQHGAALPIRQVAEPRPA